MNEEKKRKKENKEADLFLIKFLLLVITGVTIAILWYTASLYTIVTDELFFRDNPNYSRTRAYSIEYPVE